MPRNHDLFFRHIAQTSPNPLAFQVSKAFGVFLYDEQGKPHYDLISGIAVSNLGHQHPHITAAIHAQTNDYLHTMVYGEHIQSIQLRTAAKLVDHLPEPLTSVYFTNSGAEAVEGAMKLAKRYTGRYEFVACRNAYHGSTQGAMSLMSDSYFTGAYRPLLPGIRHLIFNDLSSIDCITPATAGVVLEVVQAEAGIHPADATFLRAVRKRCDETGALLIIDEIQTGMGRSGTWFAFEQYDIQPDILLVAKAFGGGLPLGAFIASGSVMQVLTHHPMLGHMTTFGGNPLSCAASLAAMEVLEQEQLIEQVAEKADLLVRGLQHKTIREIRNFGLLIALDLGTQDRVLQLVELAREEGILVDWFLFNMESIRLAPPLTISREEISDVTVRLVRALDRLDP